MNKIEKLESILRNKKIAIAFSGGADSTLILYIASKVSKDPLAITINNHIMPEGFIEHTQKVCENFGVRQEIIDIDFYENDRIMENPYDRCYLCRDEMYNLITKKAEKEGYSTIVDGTNISDLVADRPGILINYKNNIKSPFVECRLDSKEIHEYLNENGIDYSKSTTCLATRLPFNEQVTPEKLGKIDSCEKVVYDNVDCEIAKVRSLPSMNIIEVDNFNNILDENKLNIIYEQLKGLGCEKVCLNITKLDDDEEIILDYEDNGFVYHLPYDIDLEKTNIDNDRIEIKEEGTIIGRDFDSYEEALEEFMEVLPAIRRTLP